MQPEGAILSPPEQPEGAILSPPERAAAQRDVSLLVGAAPPPPPWPLRVMFHGQSEPQQ